MVDVSNSTVKNGMIPKLIKTKRPTTVWNIYFGLIQQTVCPNTTKGDQQKWELRKDITLSHRLQHSNEYDNTHINVTTLK